MTDLYDIVLFGASSFVGKITAQAMAEHYPGDEVRWAIAGRNKDKLSALKSSLGSDNPPGIIIADANDEAALANLCQQTRVVVSTVGPYSLFGTKLVKACVDHGTDYCDLTGEVPFIYQMQKQHTAQAHVSGARIVHCCGFDSIPSDLGCYYLQQQAQQQFGEPCQTVAMRVARLKGDFSGGTFASMMQVFRLLSQKPELKKSLANPYSLCPPDFNDKVRQQSVKGKFWDENSQSWAAPFVMEGVNSRVVLRSAALLPEHYGPGFRYQEAMLTGPGSKGKKRAFKITAGLGVLVTAAAFAPTRWLLENFILPKPGTGPSPKEQQEGYFRIQFYGRTPSGQQLTTEVTADRDPGYGATARMLSQAALCLLKDRPKADYDGGFWTPATLLGDTLIERLQSHAGMTFRTTAIEST